MRVAKIMFFAGKVEEVVEVRVRTPSPALAQIVSHDLQRQSLAHGAGDEQGTEMHPLGGHGVREPPVGSLSNYLDQQRRDFVCVSMLEYPSYQILNLVRQHHVSRHRLGVFSHRPCHLFSDCNHCDASRQTGDFTDGALCPPSGILSEGVLLGISLNCSTAWAKEMGAKIYYAPGIVGRDTKTTTHIPFPVQPAQDHRPLWHSHPGPLLLPTA